MVQLGGMPWQAFVYGGMAAMTAEAITFPIDMSKTRLQIQVTTLHYSVVHIERAVRVIDT